MRSRLLLAASGCLVAAVLVRESTLEGRLLRADPNSIPHNSALMQFARERGETLFEIHCSACHGRHGAADPARGVPSLDDEPSCHDVRRVIAGVFEHAAQVQFVESAVFHPLQKVRGQLKLPCPLCRL